MARGDNVHWGHTESGSLYFAMQSTRRKNSCRRWQDARGNALRRGFRGGRGFSDDAFQRGDVLQEMGAAGRSDAADRSATAAPLLFADVHQTCFPQNIEVAIEIPVSQIAQLLQVGERQPVG